MGADHSSCGGVWLPGSLPVSLQRLQLLPAAHFSFPSFLLTPVRKPEDEISVPCAERLQANSGSGALSKLLMSLGSGKGVRSEAQESLLPVQGTAFPGTGTQGHSSILHKATLAEVLEGKQHLDCDWEPPELLKSQNVAAKPECCS